MLGFIGPYSCGFCFYLGPKQCLSPQIDSSRCIFVDETDQSGHLSDTNSWETWLGLELFRVSTSQLQTPCLMLKRIQKV